MRMPSWAPRPVPTISAVGVARPRAHGQAMISTATAAVKAAAAPAPLPSQKPRVRHRQGDHDRHEDAGDPVGEPLHLGLAVLGVLDQPGHLGELGVAADPGGADDEPAAGVHRRPGHRVAGADLDRDRLAGEHRGVDRRGAALDDAVGGDLLARPDHEAVADGQLVDRCRPLAAVLEHGDVLGPQLQQRRRAAPARRLERASN